MDKKFTLKLSLNDVESTLKFASSMGEKLKGGEIIELIGDLGAGKTTLVHGLAQGAGSHDHVSSPSFTIRNDYQTKDLAIAHFDFYRLSDPGIMKDMLAEAAIDPETTVVIEWPGVVDDILPAEQIRLEIKVTGEYSREINIEYPERFAYLFPETQP